MLDPEGFTSLLLRWTLSIQYLESLDMDSLPEEHAIRVLIGSDFPLLIRELTYSQPDLRLELDAAHREASA